jgi:surfactin synthase thioesterase subunit
MNVQALGAWFPFAPDNPVADVDLFCLPYAGGSASVYRTWFKALRCHARVWAVELPGHGTRLGEVPLVLGPLIEDLTGAVAAVVDAPYALFGHSMGALLAFELARELARWSIEPPVALIVSGCAAPPLVPVRPTWDLAGATLERELRQLGGTPEELLIDQELLALRMPALQAGFRLMAAYAYVPQPALSCPVFVLGGADDPYAPRLTLQPWEAMTTADCTVHTLPGGHFFVRSSEDEVLAVIRQALSGTKRNGTGGATCPPMNSRRQAATR